MAHSGGGSPYRGGIEEIDKRVLGAVEEGKGSMGR